MNNLSVVTLFISVALVSTKSLYETRIINGDRAREGQFPYQAYLQKLDNKVFCGASIVSNRFLLTAAHCTQGNPDPTVLVAVLGAINLQEGGTTILLDTITPHEGFDMLTRSNDIALIRTASEIIFSNTVQPIALPCQNVPSEGVTHVVVSGWGKTNVSFCFKINGWNVFNMICFSGPAMAMAIMKPFGCNSWSRKQSTMKNAKNAMNIIAIMINIFMIPFCVHRINRIQERALETQVRI